jgi:hypothetical protein
VILGIPAAVTVRLAGLSPWLVVVLVAATLILGLVQTIIPQNSADRLQLLLALRRSRRRAVIEARRHHAIHSASQSCPACRHTDAAEVTVAGHLADSQDGAPWPEATPGTPAKELQQRQLLWTSSTSSIAKVRKASMS